MTKDELKARIVPRLSSKIREEWRQKTAAEKWAKGVSAIQASSAQERADLVTVWFDRDIKRTGMAMDRMMENALIADAELEADTMLADDSLTLDEIERAFQ